MLETIISIILILGFLQLSSRTVQRYFLLNKYKMVIEMLDYFLSKAYDVIYNDQIIGYTASGQKVIPADEMETIERNFVKLTLVLMGPINEKICLKFYGNRTALIDNMVLYVRNQLTQDALAKLVQEHESEIVK